MSIVDYAKVRENIGDDRAHLLLGNGFSIGCDPIFEYASLYDRAVERGLSERAQSLFSRLGTNNFEGVMHLLDRSEWVARLYGLVGGEGSAMHDDLEVVKAALVDAIAASHLENVGEVSEKKLAAACAFFDEYHNVFTTNYDLLAYWTVLSRHGGPVFVDGFGDDPNEPDSPTVVYSFRVKDQRGLFYLHGGLHLFADTNGQATKHCWSRSGEPLTALIRNGLANGQYPLFVAEGAAERKLEQIHRSSYLSYAFEKFGRIQKHLVVFGSSLSATDDHIRRAIAGNKDLKNLYIGVLGKNAASAEAAVTAIRGARKDRALKDLNIVLFDSDSAHPWGAAAAAKAA